MDKLIAPVRKGHALIDEIDSTVLTRPGVAVWWLGQSGFVLKSREATVYIDPYLSEHLTQKYADTDKPHIRMTEAPLRGDQVSNADLVLSTHRHADHMDPVAVPEILAASPQARYLLPRAHRDHVLAWGLAEARLLFADVDEPVSVKGVEILPQPAAHEGFDLIEGGGHPYMGYVLTMGGVTLYHSGDTVPFAGMIERLRAHDVDLAFLPVNGRDARRQALGTPGNCTVEESLCIAALAGVATVVPHHYDMFTFNTIDIEGFRKRAAELYPHQTICVMTCGERYMVMPPKRSATAQT